MKLCPKCQSEYRDEVATCVDDGTALVDADVWRAQRQEKAARLAETTRFVQAAVAEDPFDAEAYAAAVDAAGIPVLSRVRRAGTVDVLVTPGARAFWEVLVPEAQLGAAKQAIAARKRELEEEQGDAARAAEEEEAATEGLEVIAESESEEVADRWAKQLTTAGIAAQLRAQSDVEADTVDERDPDRTLVLVPREQADKARQVLKDLAV